MTQSTPSRRPSVWCGLPLMLFGLAAFVWPVPALTVLKLLFGVYAVADGLVALVVSRRDRHEYHYRGWVLQLGALARIALGVLICLWSSVTVPALATTVFAWSILAGAFEAVVGNATRGRRQAVWDTLAVRKTRRLGG